MKNIKQVYSQQSTVNNNKLRTAYSGLRTILLLLLLILLLSVPALPQRVDQLSTADTLSGDELFYLQQNRHDRKLTLGRLLGILASEGSADSIGVKYLIGDSLAAYRINHLHFITPEEYGADTLANDSSAIYNAIINRGNKIVLLRKDYTITSRIEIDGDSTDLRIIAMPKSRIISTADTSEQAYNIFTGHIHLTDFATVDIDGLTLEVNTAHDTIVTNDNGLVIDSADVVRFTNNRIVGADYSGLVVAHANRVTVEGNKFDSCLYAGFLPIEINDKLTVFNNDFDEIGIVLFDASLGRNYPFGYGIGLTRKWGSDSTGGIYNADIFGNRFKHIYRTAVSGHGGRSLNIYNNHVKGFGSSAFTPINEGGTSTEESFVEQVIIHHNIIENDSTWLVAGYPNDSLSTSHDPTRVIWVGQYASADQLLYNPIGLIDVSNNIMRRLGAPTLYAGILINANRNYGSSIIKSVKVTNNQMSEVYNPSYAGIIVTGTDVLRRDNPENVDIQGNTVIGQGTYGIQVSDGKIVNISNNSVTGFTYGLLGSVPYSASNNKIDSTVIADTRPLRNYMDYFKRSGTGMWNFNMEDGDSIKLKLATVNLTASQNGYGGQVFNVNIYASSYFPDYLSKFEGIVSAGYGTDYKHLIVADSMKRVYPENYRTGNTVGITKPYLTWKASVEGGDSLYTLYAVLTHNYANYFIEANFNGATPVFMEDVVDTTTSVILGKVGAIGDVTTWFNRTYDTPFFNADSIYTNFIKTDSAHITGTASIDSAFINYLRTPEQISFCIDYPYVQTFNVWKTPTNIVLDSVNFITQDSSVTFNITAGYDITSMSSVMASDIASNNTTGETVSSFADNTIEKGKYVAFNITAVEGGADGDVEQLTVVFYYRKQ